MVQTVKNLPDARDPGIKPRKVPWRRKWLPTPVFLFKELHGQRSLAGYSPWVAKSMGCKVHGLDMTATNNNLYILQSKAKSYSPSDIRNLMYSIRKLPLFSALFSVENVYSEKTELLDSSC